MVAVVHRAAEVGATDQAAAAVAGWDGLENHSDGEDGGDHRENAACGVFVVRARALRPLYRRCGVL